MQFDPENKIVQLCAQGMTLEGEGKPDMAAQAFRRAWYEASNNLEKAIAAHYVARHQQGVTDKLKWDEQALFHALQTKDESVKEFFPSLYLNIGKCYEDLHDHNSAAVNYRLALSFADSLPDDGYGQMIRSGIRAGLQRLQAALP